MQFPALMAVCAMLGGCAVAGMPSMPTLGGGEPEPVKPQVAASQAAAQPPAKTETPQPKQEAAGGSFLNSVWDNFSTPFRSGVQPVAQTAPEPKPVFSSEEALRLINDYRAAKKLKPLSIEDRAQKAAAAHSVYMAKNDRMEHDEPNGSDVGKRLNDAGYKYHLAAENIGAGQKTVQEVVDGWKKSPPHSKNMLLPGAKHIGIAVETSTTSKYKTFWTLVLAAP